MAISEALKKLVAQSANKYKASGGKASKLAEGRNVLRFIPSKDSNPQFWRDLGIHWIKATLDGKPVAVVGDCDFTYQQPSVINTAIDMAITHAMDEDSKKLYTEWKTKKSVLANVVNRTAGEEVQTLELTTTTFGKVLDQVMLYAEEGVDILDPNTGYDIVITKSGKGLNTSYDVAVAPLAPGKTFKAVTKEQLEGAADLDAFIASNFFRGEEQKALNFIAQIAGVRVPTLAVAGSATPTAALTAPSATVAGATVAPAAAVVSGPTPEEIALEARRAALLRKQADMQREMDDLENASVIEAIPVATVETATMSDLPMSEQDAILAELDNLK